MRRALIELRGLLAAAVLLSLSPALPDVAEVTPGGLVVASVVEVAAP